MGRERGRSRTLQHDDSHPGRRRFHHGGCGRAERDNGTNYRGHKIRFGKRHFLHPRGSGGMTSTPTFTLEDALRQSGAGWLWDWYRKPGQAMDQIHKLLGTVNAHAAEKL